MKRKRRNAVTGRNRDDWAARGNHCGGVVILAMENKFFN